MASGEHRTLVLLRHAKSAWPDVPDHDRPLARRGRRDAPAMGSWLGGAGYVPDQVVCSTARRARQTWELVQSALGVVPAAVFDDRVYEASAARLLDLIRRTPAVTRTLLIVGHDPAVPELARTLAAAPRARAGTGNDAAPAAMLGRMHAKFPTAAIAVFECTGDWAQLTPGRARLAWFVTPRELRAPADPGPVPDDH
jgi:phosphohistidine phosphatase